MNATGNLIHDNVVHSNGRAGIAILGSSSGNTVRGNDATGNGLLNLSPSLFFDLFAANPSLNTWNNNQGTSNIGTTSAMVSSVSAAEVFGEGGCMRAR